MILQSLVYLNITENCSLIQIDKTLFNEDAYLTIVNLSLGPQKHKTNTRRTILEEKYKNITKQHYTVISVHVHNEKAHTL